MLHDKVVVKHELERPCQSIPLLYLDWYGGTPVAGNHLAQHVVVGIFLVYRPVGEQLLVD